MGSVNMQSIFGYPWWWWLAAFALIGSMLYLGHRIGETVTAA